MGIEKITFSKQAKLVIMETNTTEQEVLDWILSERGILLGGGDVIDFLSARRKEGQ